MKLGSKETSHRRPWITSVNSYGKSRTNWSLAAPRRNWGEVMTTDCTAEMCCGDHCISHIPWGKTMPCVACLNKNFCAITFFFKAGSSSVGMVCSLAEVSFQHCLLGRGLVLQGRKLHLKGRFAVSVHLGFLFYQVGKWIEINSWLNWLR